MIPRRARDLLRGAPIVLLCAFGTSGAADARPKSAPAAAEAPEAAPLGVQGLRFPHEIHVDEGCDTCHEISKGRPSLPDHDTCEDCHDEVAEEPSVEACGYCHTGPAGAPLADPDDIAVERRRAPGWEDVRFDHTLAAEDEESCAGCHAGMLSRSDLEGELLPTMADSVAGFHHLGGDASDCRACHQRLGPDVPPAGHTEAFRFHHGMDRQLIGSGQCDLCHQLDDCTTCHRATPPPDHVGRGWTKFHGREFGDIERGRCLLCHQEDSCVQCHQTQMPESHTNFWRLRGHGQMAAVDRRSCMVCHQEDTCIACHTSVSPKLPQADYHEPGADCLLCHGPGSIVKPARVHGPPGQEACLDCHQFGRSKRGRPPGPFMPRAEFHQDDAQNCLPCHAPSSPIRPLRRHQPYPVELCTVCHEVGGRRLPTPPPIPGFHQGNPFFADCGGCHADGSFGAPIPPHPIYPNQYCMLCHEFE